MNTAIKSDGELKMLAHDFHDTFRHGVDEDSFEEPYVREIIKELIKRGYTIAIHSTLMIDK